MPQDHPDGTIPMQITGADKKLPLDFQDQYVGVHTEAEFETKQAKDKNLSGADTVPDSTYTGMIDYTVPAGKTLYICQWGANVRADTGIIGSLAQVVDSFVTIKALDGGTAGYAISFTRPIAFAAGVHCVVAIMHFAGADKICDAFAMGYEL